MSPPFKDGGRGKSKTIPVATAGCSDRCLDDGADSSFLGRPRRNGGVVMHLDGAASARIIAIWSRATGHTRVPFLDNEDTRPDSDGTRRALPADGESLSESKREGANRVQTGSRRVVKRESRRRTGGGLTLHRSHAGGFLRLPSAEDVTAVADDVPLPAIIARSCPAAGLPGRRVKLIDDGEQVGRTSRRAKDSSCRATSAGRVCLSLRLLTSVCRRAEGLTLARQQGSSAHFLHVFAPRRIGSSAVRRMDHQQRPY